MSSPAPSTYYILRTEEGLNLSPTKFDTSDAATDYATTLASEGYDLSYVIKVTECPIRRVATQRTTTQEDLS